MDFTDRIGDRLDHPERVPPEYRHLIADDQQRVQRILAFPVSGDVLDVGCSDGAITGRIAKAWPKARVVGADMRDPGVVWAGPSLGFITWDATESWGWSSEPTSNFDHIFACEFFEHLTDADAETALANIVAILKPEGSLIVTVPNRDCDERYVAGCRDRWRWPDHRSVWTAEKLHRFLKPYFGHLMWHPLYDEDVTWGSIFLIVQALEKR